MDEMNKRHKSKRHKSKRLMTRKELVPHIRDTLGVPVTKGSFDKKAADGKGPPVAAKYGRVELYDPDVSIEWARSLLKESI
jgi:hypothetical protein